MFKKITGDSKSIIILGAYFFYSKLFLQLCTALVKTVLIVNPSVQVSNPVRRGDGRVLFETCSLAADDWNHSGGVTRVES